jgi:hypothetical protein
MGWLIIPTWCFSSQEHPYSGPMMVQQLSWNPAAFVFPAPQKILAPVHTLRLEQVQLDIFQIKLVHMYLLMQPRVMITCGAVFPVVFHRFIFTVSANPFMVATITYISICCDIQLIPLPMNNIGHTGEPLQTLGRICAPCAPDLLALTSWAPFYSSCHINQCHPKPGCCWALHGQGQLIRMGFDPSFWV